MRIVLAMTVVLFAGCASAPSHGNAPLPNGPLFASIKMTASAFKGRTKRDTGFFFYVEGPSNAYPMLIGYEVVDGKVRDEFDGGSNSAQVIRAIAAIGLEPFDFEKEVQEIELGLQKELSVRKPGVTYLGPLVMDGAEYEIVIMTEKGRFSLRAGNPSYTIDAYARYSQRIAKLKAVMDLLAQYYGHLKFGT